MNVVSRQPTLPSTRVFREVIQLAKEKAIGFGHSFLAPEHVLLALFESGDDIVKNVFTLTGVSQDKVLLEVLKLFPINSEHRKSGNVPLSPAVRVLLDYAQEERGRLDHPAMDAIHLLLGLLELETHPNFSSNGALTVLRRLRVNLTQMRVDLMHQLERN